jgi:hypothetical protein
MKVSPFVSTLYPIKSVQDAQNVINSILSKFNRQDREYVSIISNLRPDSQNLFWQVRTLLFYQMLVILTNVLSNETLFRELYPERAWREDVARELSQFELGIFGSITPTSDIDVGLQFSGTLKTPVLAYVIDAFETLFLKLTTRTTLNYDIEMYADMMTVKKNGNDVFYLTTTDFTQQHFLALLPVALLSMARNCYFAEDKRTIKQLKDLTMIQALPAICTSAELEWKTACDEMDKYFQLSYNDQRAEYYRRVERAETTKIEFTSMETLSVSQQVVLMELLGKALAYREESYLLAPTIVHVVRVLQGEKNNYKYRTSTPAELCTTSVGPICGMGYYGYLLSAMEQIGFLTRFTVRYCDKEGYENEKQCAKKMEKYLGRFGDALFHVDAMREEDYRPLQGGRTRRKRRSNRSRRQTTLLKKA